MMAKTQQEQNTEKLQQMMHFINNLINNIELDLKRIKVILDKLEKFDPLQEEAAEILYEVEKTINPQWLKTYDDDNTQVIEGIFDGYFMLGSDQKKYPMPLNYASKTKLVPWDKLKLRILADGKLIYKLIEPVERKHQKARLSLTDDNKPIAITDEGQTYFLNHAAITYFKGKAGDDLYIVTNIDGTGGFAAIEAVIKQ